MNKIEKKLEESNTAGMQSKPIEVNPFVPDAKYIHLYFGAVAIISAGVAAATTFIVLAISGK